VARDAQKPIEPPQDNNPEVGTRDMILVTADFWTSLHSVHVNISLAPQNRILITVRFLVHLQVL
jgi:hypothetical protein